MFSCLEFNISLNLLKYIFKIKNQKAELYCIFKYPFIFLVNREEKRNQSYKSMEEFFDATNLNKEQVKDLIHQMLKEFIIDSVNGFYDKYDILENPFNSEYRRHRMIHGNKASVIDGILYFYDLKTAERLNLESHYGDCTDPDDEEFVRYFYKSSSASNVKLQLIRNSVKNNMIELHYGTTPRLSLIVFNIKRSFFNRLKFLIDTWQDTFEMDNMDLFDQERFNIDSDALWL